MRVEGLHAVPQLQSRKAVAFTFLQPDSHSGHRYPLPCQPRLPCAIAQIIFRSCMSLACEEIHARSRRLTSDEGSGCSETSKCVLIEEETRPASRGKQAEAHRSLGGLDWTNFFMADINTGVGPFLSNLSDCNPALGSCKRFSHRRRGHLARRCGKRKTLEASRPE